MFPSPQLWTPSFHVYANRDAHINKCVSTVYERWGVLIPTLGRPMSIFMFYFLVLGYLYLGRPISCFEETRNNMCTLHHSSFGATSYTSMYICSCYTRTLYANKYTIEFHIISHPYGYFVTFSKVPQTCRTKTTSYPRQIVPAITPDYLPAVHRF